jgi:D-beta-D-heptose 7-phosphate kinase/D-beta-D-heptose 1-phosphate adenosyltransferase
MDRFASLKVLVVGDAILDTYLRGSTTRLCREAPAPVLTVVERCDAPGGAANAAHNIQSLGGQALFVSAIGEDFEGQLLECALQAAGVQTDRLVRTGRRRTLSKQRLVADGQMLVRFDQGTTAPLDPETERRMLANLAEAFLHTDAVLVSDYAYGTLTHNVLRTLHQLQSAAQRVLVVDARRLSRYRALAPTAVKPNYVEAMTLLGHKPRRETASRVAQLESVGECLLRLTGARICAVTLDADGALVFEGGRRAYRAYSRPAPAVRSTGAGDTFAAALTLVLAAGGDTAAAVEIASAASAAVVGRDGTVACAAHDLRDAVVRGAHSIHAEDSSERDARLAAS